MEYRIGNSKLVWPLGKTTKLVCPHCQKTVEFSIFSNIKASLVAKLPVLELKNVVFLVCPACASVYGMKETAAESLKSGNLLAIGNYDFEELEKFK